MSDPVLQLAHNSMARRMLGWGGVRLPAILQRAEGPCQAQPLSGQTIVLSDPTGPLHPTIEQALAAAGAPPLSGPPQPDQRFHALVCDASAIDQLADLATLHAFFHPRLSGLRQSGRVVLIGRSLAAEHTPEEAATRAALVGFVRSLARELGRHGTTANLITVAQGAETGLAGALRFLLSPRAAYISAQVLRVTVPCTDPAWVQGLAGRTALVTGAARGIGRATVERLAAEGARVIGVDLPGDEQLTSTMAEIGGIPLGLDITRGHAVDRIIEAAGAPLDVVIHNAGVTRDRTLKRMPAESWALPLEVNLRAVMAISQDLHARDQLAPGARLVLVSSVAGISGNAGQTNYAASKAGVIGLTRALGDQLRATHGIATNAVAPGFIETRMTAAIPLAIRTVGRRLCALSQGGLPIDVAEAITFLASPSAGGLNGAVLRVCGGSLLGA